MSERSRRSGSKWRPLRLAAGALLLFGLALLVVALFISATPLGEAAFGLVILGLPTLAAGGLLWWLEGVDAKAKMGEKSRRRRRRRRSLGDASRFTASEQMSMSPSELGPVTLVGFDAEADPDLDPAVPFRPSMADWTLSRPAPLSPAPMPLSPAVSLPFRRSRPAPLQTSGSMPLDGPDTQNGPARDRSASMSPSARMPLEPLQPPAPAAAVSSARPPTPPLSPPSAATGPSEPSQPSLPFGRSRPMPLDPLADSHGDLRPTRAAGAERFDGRDNAGDDGVAVPYRRSAASSPSSSSTPRERSAEPTAALRQPTPPSTRVPLPNPESSAAAPMPTAAVAPSAPLPEPTAAAADAPAPLRTLAPVPAAAPAQSLPMGATLRQGPSRPQQPALPPQPPSPPLPAPVPARAATPLSPPPKPQSWQAPPLPLAPLQLPPLAVPPVPMPESMAPLSVAPLPLPPLVLPPLVLPPLMLPPMPYPLPGGSSGEAAPSSHELQPEPTGWSVSMLAGLHWRRFEAVVETLYRQAGFRVRAQPHGSHGGLHIWLYSRHQVGPPVSVVRCERGHGVAVGAALLRELSGVMFAQGARRGHFVSGVGFTVEAHNYAQRHGIHLLDVPGLLALIQARSADQQHALLEAAQERP